MTACRLVFFATAALVFVGLWGQALAVERPKDAIAELQGLAESAQQAYEAKDFKKAISLLKKILSAGPHPMFEFNLACAYAQDANPQKALLHLEKAVNLGFIDAAAIEKEEDLLPVRTSPKFAKILQKARAAAEAQEKAFANVPAPQDIVLPAKDLKPGDKSPLLIFLHGMGSSPDEIKDAVKPLADSWKYTVFLPCGSRKLGIRPDGKPGYTWDARKDVQFIVEKTKKMTGVDPRQVYLGGFSAGASIAYLIALESPETFSGVVGFSGALEKELLTEQTVRAAAGKVPIYIVHGRQDQVMPIALGRDANEYFTKKGFRVTLNEYDGGHGLPSTYFDVFKDAIEWFHKEAPRAAAGTDFHGETLEIDDRYGQEIEFTGIGIRVPLGKNAYVRVDDPVADTREHLQVVVRELGATGQPVLSNATTNGMCMHLRFRDGKQCSFIWARKDADPLLTKARLEHGKYHAVCRLAPMEVDGISAKIRESGFDLNLSDYDAETAATVIEILTLHREGIPLDNLGGSELVVKAVGILKANKIPPN